MDTGPEHQSVVLSDSSDPGSQIDKIDMFYAYMGIEDRGKFWREASFLAKAKFILVALVFNFILFYKFLRCQPLVKE